MIELKLDKIYYKEKINDKGKTNRFYTLVLKDTNGNEYRSICGWLDLDDAKRRYLYFNGKLDGVN